MADSNPNPTEGFSNVTRHEHELFRFEGLPPYKCSGCEEFGGKVGYMCKFKDSICHNFTLHEACATVPDEYQHSQHGPLKFRPKTQFTHHCNACQDVLKGFVFETERHHLMHALRLHPLCMLLPPTLQYNGHKNHRLVMDDSEVDAYTCNACNKQIHSGGWRYLCKEVTCQVKVDLSCAKIDIYGLSVGRIADVSRSKRFTSKLSTPGKAIGTALLGTATVVASTVAGDVIINEISERTSNLGVETEATSGEISEPNVVNDDNSPANKNLPDKGDDEDDNNEDDYDNGEDNDYDNDYDNDT